MPDDSQAKQVVWNFASNLLNFTQKTSKKWKE